MVSSLVSEETLFASFGLLTGVSLGTFVISLLIIPLVVARLPQDCFDKLQLPPKASPPASAGKMAIVLLRNLFGMCLLLAGILMLFLPGQGLLTILLGLLLLSIPGKSRLVLILTASPSIRRGLDWLRKKSGKPPFLWPQSPAQHYGSGEKGR